MDDTAVVVVVAAAAAVCKESRVLVEEILGSCLEVYSGERIEIGRVKTEYKKREEKYVKVVEDMY